MPEFSIVVPAHNCESTIERSIDSLLSQDFTDYEIIIVDDASTDNTSEVIKKIVESHDNVSAVFLQENVKGATARKRGVAQSSGKYIMFLDADDTYSPNTLSTLHRELKRTPVDIMHFGIEVKCPDSHRKRNLEKYFAPYPGKLKGKGCALEACFVDDRFRWNLVNKVFSGDMCREALSALPEKRIQRADDLYVFTYLAHCAQSYRGLPNTFLYQYNFGEGEDGDKAISLKDFDLACDSSVYAHEIANSLELWDVPTPWKAGFGRIEDALIDNCVYRLQNNVSTADQPAGVEVLCEKWGEDTTIAALMRRYWNEEGDAARILMKTHFAGHEAKQVKHVGAYYRVCEGGGAEAVMRILAKLWKSIGYEVTLFADEEPHDQSILPDGVNLVVLPMAERPHDPDSNAASYIEHAKAFSEAIKENGIDAIVYHDWLNRGLLWDMLAIKAAGASFVVHCHGLFTFRMREQDIAFAHMPFVYAIADGIVSINETDQMFWSKFNDNVYLTPNPLSLDPAKVEPKVCKDKRVLWLGRISPEKRPEDALKIFSYIHELDPEVTFCMAGKAADPHYERKIRDLAEKLGLSDVLEMPGWRLGGDKVEAFLNARVFLMTSEATEGYPLTLAESKVAGVPCVMYDLPYLTMVRQGKGIKVVPQGSTLFAATEALAILEDDELYLKLKEEARKSIEPAIEFDFAAFWKAVFSSLEAARPVKGTDLELFWDVFLEAYQTGAMHAWDEVKRLKKSYTWKAGRMAIYVPRKVKRLAKRLFQ